MKVLHLNDFKNIIKRIRDRENRKKQEMFSYITCGYTNNADVNVIINTIS